MPNNSALKLITITALIFLIGTGCDIEVNAPDLEVKPNPIKAPPELIEKIKATGWLDLSLACNAGRVSMRQKDYLECLLVDAALLPPFDPANRDHFSRHYDPKEYYECRKKVPRNYGSCVIHKMRRDEPEPVWPYPEVPPIQWPEAPKESVYKWHMNNKEYFQALCKAEAGKFIYKTVENVEGVYQVRPLRNYIARDFVLQDMYVYESPYQGAIDNAGSPGFNLLNPGEYDFVETALYDPRSKSILRKYYPPSFSEEPPEYAKYIRYEGEVNSDYDVEKKYVAELKSQYGYVWRGIKRPLDREHGIAGGEVAVIDLKTNEILALWRGFLASGISNRDKVWWLSGAACPKVHGYKDMLDTFMVQVLKPKRANSVVQGESE